MGQGQDDQDEAADATDCALVLADGGDEPDLCVLCNRPPSEHVDAGEQDDLPAAGG